ncbi:MAG: hypothetical protein ABIK18_01070 [candidate division WOR-3 bacterium]
MRNPKSEILNSKQVQSTNVLNPKCFDNWDFGIRNCLGFSALKLGFINLLAVKEKVVKICVNESDFPIQKIPGFRGWFGKN